MLLKIKQVLAKIWPVTISRYGREIWKQNQQAEILATDIQELKRQQREANLKVESIVTQQTDMLLMAVQDSEARLTEMMLKLVRDIEKQQNIHNQLIQEYIQRDEAGITSLQKNIQNIQLQLCNQKEEIQETREQVALLTDAEQKVKEIAETDLLKTQNIVAEISKLKANIKDSSGYVCEVLWAEIFNSASISSTWLLDKTFSPGRWAVGYQFLYVMYRVLNEIKPKSILEFGLGQSTRMIAQYVMKHEGVEHIVIEDNPDWVNFFVKDFTIPSCCKIEMCETEMVSFREAEQVRKYKGSEDRLKGRKFDFIVIDGPLGGDMMEYARIDVLQILDECLCEKFVILLDDFQRSGEQHTAMEIETCLKKQGILYKKGKYSGKKECVIFCSQNLGFLTTM